MYKSLAVTVNLQLPCILWFINPLPCGTIANFFLTAVGPIQHTVQKRATLAEKDNSDDFTGAGEGLCREETARQLLITPPFSDI